jgi:acetoin utilization deacetylase AcuC-like enzyme
LTDAGLYHRDHYVLTECLRAGVSVACVIGGGYSADIDALARRHSTVHRAASVVWEAGIGG